jgi:hypothetical protein
VRELRLPEASGRPWPPGGQLPSVLANKNLSSQAAPAQAYVAIIDSGNDTSLAFGANVNSGWKASGVSLHAHDPSAGRRRQPTSHYRHRFPNAPARPACWPSDRIRLVAGVGSLNEEGLWATAAQCLPRTAIKGNELR